MEMEIWLATELMLAGLPCEARHASVLLDELTLHVLLGSGTRLPDDVGGVRLEQASAVAGDDVLHVTYRVLR